MPRRVNHDRGRVCRIYNIRDIGGLEMTTYMMMTMAIESFTECAILFEKDGSLCENIRGMIRGVELVRDSLSIEAASCEC